MKENNKTQAQLIKEAAELRRRVAELEASGRERNRFEETLRTERDKAQQYLDIAEVILVALNKKGEITLINRKGNQILGYNEGELLGKNWFTTCLPSHLRKKMKSGFLKLMTGEREITEFYEKPVLTKSRTERIIDWHNSILKDTQGATIGTLSSGEDITERKQAEESLKESESRFRNIIESSKDGIIFFDGKTRKILFGNGAMAELLGCSKEDLVGRSIPSLHPSEEWKSIEREFQKHVSGEISVSTAIPVQRDDGSVFYADISSSRITLEGKAYFSALFHDITERKRTDKALQESEKNFRRSLDESPLGIRIVTAEGETLYANRAALEIYGYDSVEELERTPLTKRYTPESYVEFKKRKEKRDRGEFGPSEYEISVVRKDGEVRRVQVFRKQIMWNNQRQFQVIYHDITQRKKTEKALRENEEKFRQAFENANTGVCLVDLEGNLSRVNTKMCEIFGYTKGELEHMTVNDIAYPEDIDKSPEFIQKTLQGKIDRGAFEKRYIHKKGHVVTCEVSSSLVRDAEETPLYFISHVNDITARKKAEAQIERALRETSLRFEISQALAGTQTEDEVLDVLIQHSGFYPQVFVVIYTFDKTEGEVAAIVRRQNPFESGLTPMLPIGARLPVSNYTLLSRISPDQPFVSDDIFADEKIETYGRDILAKTGVASIAVFPLMIDNEWMCLIMAMAKSIGYFDEEKQHLYQTLAEQGAVALRAARLREQIRESQRRFQGLVETLSDWIWEVDENGIYTYVSPRIRDLLGYEWKEVLGKTPFDLMPTEETERVKTVFESLLAAHQPIVALENTCRHKNGSLVVFETSGVPFFDAVGQFKGYRGVDRDITERKLAEEAILRINKAVESAGDAIGMSDAQGHHFYHNKAFTELFEYTPEELEAAGGGTAAYADKKVAFEVFKTIMSGESWSGEVEMISKNGRKFPVLLRADAIKDESGKLIGLVGVHTDITERKRAEEALRASEEKYRDLVENINDILYAIDVHGIITYISPAIETISGYAVSEIIGRSFFDFVHEKDIPYMRDKFGQDIFGRAEPHEYHMVTKSGDVRWVRTSSRPFFKGDSVVGLRGILTDITERKQAEGEAKRGYEQLQETLHSTVKALASTVEMKDQYTAGHQPRVTQLACAIAGEMGLSEDQIEGIRMAASIHDIGKIMVPAEILNKPGPLSEIQYEMIKMHPRAGYDILKGLKLPWPVAQIILQHHERLDGSGYPQGLSGEEIMVEARILTVANVVEAMNAHRPYRPAYDIKEALAEISKNRVTWYDPAVVDACLRLFTEKGFTLAPVSR